MSLVAMESESRSRDGERPLLNVFSFFMKLRLALFYPNMQVSGVPFYREEAKSCLEVTGLGGGGPRLEPTSVLHHHAMLLFQYDVATISRHVARGSSDPAPETTRRSLSPSELSSKNS